MTRLRAVLEIAALMSIISVCGAMIYVITHSVPGRTAGPATARSVAIPRVDNVIPLDPASLDGAQIEGNRAAKFAVIEYSDFQCPFCGRFATQTFPQFEKQYVQSGKVLFAFRQFPLESIHPYALKAAEAAECAADQGQFWKMHTLTFADQEHLNEAALHDQAAKTGLDVTQFDKCLQGDVANRVRADEKSGKDMLVAGTPTFFIGMIQSDGRVKIVKRMSGAIPFDQFKAALDGLLGAPAAVRNGLH